MTNTYWFSYSQGKHPFSHSVLVIALQVTEITNMAKERVDLAKALIRAVDKPRPKSRAKPGEGEKHLAITNGEATAA